MTKLLVNMLADKWLGVHFQSSSMPTPQFTQFARDYKAVIKSKLEEQGLELVSFNRGHFYISGFIRNPETSRLAYFSISDVRGDDSWFSNMLIRTAEHDRDYTGGANCFTPLSALAVTALSLTEAK